LKHYFINDPQAPVNQKEITFWFLGVEEKITSDDGLFSKETLDFGSRLLAETVNSQPALTGDVLDLGCGLGYIGLLLKKYHPDINVTMSDVNAKAVSTAALNSQQWGQKNETILSDGFVGMTDRYFDCIVCNPPIRTGKSVIYPLLDAAIEHLKPRGSLFIVMRKAQGAASMVTHLTPLATVTVCNREKGYWVIQACR
jgi:16S rRNA (guanine1207-N2)-methyltransferase